MSTEVVLSVFRNQENEGEKDITAETHDCAVVPVKHNTPEQKFFGNFSFKISIKMI